MYGVNRLFRLCNQRLLRSYAKTPSQRRYRSVSCPARLVLPQADTGTSHRLTHLNLRDISTHIKLEDKIFLHFIAQSCTGLNAKHQGG